jgi:cytochrome c oxidase subunit 2
MWSFPLFPEQASTVAGKVDAVYFALVAITAFFTLVVYGLVFFFAVKYRRGTNVDRSNPPASSHKLEMLWIGVPLVIGLAIFTWSTGTYFSIYRAPAGAMEVNVVGKQWMWKLQSPNGTREINELHVPVGRAVKLIMTSQDVIHSFYVPAFRIKQDVLPGRYTSVWFQATKPGTYHLFCAEYCGTQHSGMIGSIVVMEPTEYQAWLSGGNVGETPAAAGKRLVTQLGCASCHLAGSGGRAPSFEGLFGTVAALQGGATATVDEDYVRESIINPRSKIVQGYDPIMPTYTGQITEEGILQIIAYLKSIGAGAASSGGAAGAAGGAASGAASGAAQQPVGQQPAAQGSAAGTTTGSTTGTNAVTNARRGNR